MESFHPKGFLKHNVSLVILLLLVRPVLLAPADRQPNCTGLLDRAKSLSNLLQDESNKTLEVYTKVYGDVSGPCPDEVPAVAISGSGAAERLRSVHATEALLLWHLSRVEGYEQTSPEELKELLAAQIVPRIKTNHLPAVRQLITILGPEKEAATVAPPPDFEPLDKRCYGGNVLSRLVELFGKVVEEMEDMEEKAACDGKGL